jgi:isoquinoline 1-oxidoreductase beta subunit
MGASVRRMLEEAAAERWGASVEDVVAINHQVIHKSLGITLGYGDLAETAMALPTPARDAVRFKDEKEFRYVGKGVVQIYDLFDITTGKAVYAADVSLPGMKYAVVARPPVVGGKVASLDPSAAMKVPGVEKIMTLPGTPAPYKFGQLGGVAVVARSTWAALQGRDALKITWDDGPNKVYDSKAYKAQLEASVKKAGKVERNEGDVDKALASAAKVVTAEYYAPHIAHATMEPPAATARMSGGKWEVWAPVQSPGQARDDIAKAVGVKPEEMVLHTTLLGGGFGRKSKCDFAIAGQGGVDARGRSAPRLLPHRDGGALRSGARCRQQGRRLAAPQRGTDHPVDL